MFFSPPHTLPTYPHSQLTDQSKAPPSSLPSRHTHPLEPQSVHSANSTHWWEAQARSKSDSADTGLADTVAAHTAAAAEPVVDDEAPAGAAYTVSAAGTPTQQSRSSPNSLAAVAMKE